MNHVKFFCDFIRVVRTQKKKENFQTKFVTFLLFPTLISQWRTTETSNEVRSSNKLFPLSEFKGFHKERKFIMWVEVGGKWKLYKYLTS